MMYSDFSFIPLMDAFLLIFYRCDVKQYSCVLHMPNSREKVIFIVVFEVVEVETQ